MVWIGMSQRPMWLGHQPVLLLGRGGNFRKGGLIESRLVIWECDLEGEIGTLALLSLFTSHHELSSFLQHVLPHHKLKSNGAN